MRKPNRDNPKAIQDNFDEENARVATTSAKISCQTQLDAEHDFTEGEYGIPDDEDDDDEADNERN